MQGSISRKQEPLPRSLSTVVDPPRPRAGVPGDSRPEGGAAAALAVDGDRPTHAEGEIARDREAEAGTAEAPRRVALGLGKLLENAGALFSRHADASVGDFDTEVDPLAVAFEGLDAQRNRDTAPLGELD